MNDIVHIDIVNVNHVTVIESDSDSESDYESD